MNIGGDKTVNSLEIRHKEAYEYILHNQSELLDNILLSLLSEYSNMQDEYGYDDDEIDEYMPSVNNIHDFSKLMVLQIWMVIPFQCMIWKERCVTLSEVEAALRLSFI